MKYEQITDKKAKKTGQKEIPPPIRRNPRLVKEKPTDACFIWGGSTFRPIS